MRTVLAIEPVVDHCSFSIDLANDYFDRTNRFESGDLCSLIKIILKNVNKPPNTSVYKAQEGSNRVETRQPVNLISENMNGTHSLCEMAKPQKREVFMGANSWAILMTGESDPSRNISTLPCMDLDCVSLRQSILNVLPASDGT